MKRKFFPKTLAVLLTLCMTVPTTPPASVSAREDSASADTQRFFIVSETSPSGTELAQKVSLAGSEFAVKGVCDSISVAYGDTAQTKDDDIVVQISDTLSHDSYEINADQKPLSITAGSPSGALYGLRSILKSTMLGQTVVTTSETPDVAQRIFHLDCGRKYFSKDWIISLVKELSWLQMNQLELDFSNGTGFRFALNDMSLDVDGDGTADEDLSVLPGGTTDPNSYLTEAEMDEIIETADAYGVEIVPCLDTPGHTGWIFGKEPFTKYSSNGDLDVDNQEATAFTKALVKKYAAYFVSKGCTTFHIGGDEYLHAYVGWLSHPASTEGKYASVV